jgi:hypothetical protein
MANEEKFGMPSSGKIKNGAMGMASGVGGGVIVNLISRFTGSSTIGQVLAAVVGLSVLPEKDGHVLATVIGYQLGLNLSSGLAAGSSSSSSDSVIR